MIRRILESKINKDLSPQKTIIMLGARQVRKTTLLKEIVKNDKDVLVFNGDEPDTKTRLSGVTTLQLKNLLSNAQTVIIDEAQLIPDIGITSELLT